MHRLRKKKRIYTEAEAAQKLGISIAQLRSLVRSYVCSDTSTSADATLLAGDLILLRVLAERSHKTTPVR